MAHEGEEERNGTACCRVRDKIVMHRNKKKKEKDKVN